MTMIIDGHYIGPGADLRGVDLSWVDLTGANLTGANLTGANLTLTNLGGVDLMGASLQHTNLRTANLADADLTGADLTGADLYKNTSNRGANLTGANLTGANLSEAYLYKLDLTGAILDGAIMLDARLISNTISRASFKGAILVDAEIRGTPNEESGVDFSNADLRGVKISQLFLRDSDLTGAQFSLNTDENSEYIECLSGLPYTNPCYEPGVIEFLVVAKRNGCLGLNTQPVLDAFRHTLDIFHANRRVEAIEAGCYAGFVEGLWIHQTDAPQFRYSGELCVSPYSDEEERFYRGGRIFGVIISGEAELFLDDVWSVPDAFGRLIPNRFTLREDHHKEAFIDGDKMTIVGLTYPSYAERDPKCRKIIKEWRGAGYLTIPILLP